MQCTSPTQIQAPSIQEALWKPEREEREWGREGTGERGAGKGKGEGGRGGEREERERREGKENNGGLHHLESEH